MEQPFVEPAIVYTISNAQIAEPAIVYITSSAQIACKT